MKEKYRTRYLSVRKNIKNKNILDNDIYNQVIINKHVINSKLILIYVSTDLEVDTIKLIEYFLMNNKVIAVPKIENNQMNFYYINSLDELKKGNFNILEPVTNNLVTHYSDTVSITPGICFSKEGYRIGYGKGYYDKFYQEHNYIYKIGVCYKECYLDSIPCDKYDVKVDEIITNL